MGTFDVERVLSVLPTPRLAPYLRETDGDQAKALELYLWNARVAGAALEQISHLEILLRHSVDRCLRDAARERVGGIPWFLLPEFMNGESEKAVEAVRIRLRPQGRETRDQIVAGLSFGFWSGFFGSKREELWRSELHHVFPNGNGQRKQVSSLVDRIRKFWNRVAHHDSLLRQDVMFEISQIQLLAELIDRDFSEWMRESDRSSEIIAARPVFKKDEVCIVAGRNVWSNYAKAGWIDLVAWMTLPVRTVRSVPTRLRLRACARAIEGLVHLSRG